MKEVIVVAGCTHKDGLADEYAGQLERAGIDFHLETIAPMPDGPNSMTMARRVSFIRSMANEYSNYQYLICSDAWDVLYFGTKTQLVNDPPTHVVCAAERNCYPEPHLAPLIDKGAYSPWRYANAGLIGGPRDMLLRWCDEVERLGELDILDQAWLNRRRSEESSHLVHLDAKTRLFYVVSSCLEQGELQVKDGRLWNSVCDTYPAFFHFSGRCSTDGIRKMLEATQ